MDSKKEILALLPQIVPEEKIEGDGSISGYTIGEDGKLFQGGKYANIQYDTKYLLWRLDLPYDEVCDKINRLRCNPMFIKGKYTSVPMPAACIEEYFYFKNINDIYSFIEIGDKNLSMYANAFPIIKQKEWESLKTYSEKDDAREEFNLLREVYPAFYNDDLDAVKKTIEKIDYIKFLKAIRYIYDVMLNQMHPDEHTKNVIIGYVSAIDNRVKEIKEGKTFIGRLTKKSNNIFLEEPQFKPKDDIIKGYLNEFISDDENKPMLCGVYHDGERGYAVASDGHNLAAISSAYNEKMKGKSVQPDGKINEGKYPNWWMVIPSKDRLTRLDLNLDDLWKFVAKLDKQNAVKVNLYKDAKNSGVYIGCRIGINIRGKWVSYSIGNMLNLLSLAKRLSNGHLYVLEAEYPMILYITDDKKPSYILSMPCKSDVEYEGQSVVVADHYGNPILCEYFYEGDKNGKQENKKDDSRMRMIQLQAKAAVAKLKLLEGKK